MAQKVIFVQCPFIADILGWKKLFRYTITHIKRGFKKPYLPTPPKSRVVPKLGEQSVYIQYYQTFKKKFS